jgi:maltose O-acetyltransferase
MSVLDPIIELAAVLRSRVEAFRMERRWAKLRHLGMRIGQGVTLPDSTWIDTSHCFLITIEDWCFFGPDCLILAHDAQMDEFLDAGRIGQVLIRSHSHIGARTVILPGVEIGPRTIVGANSVVSRTLPPDTVCAGNPARVLRTLDEYLEWHRSRMKTCPTFDYMSYDDRFLTPERRAELVAAVATSDAYIVGGHSATLRGEGGGTRMTDFGRRQPSDIS